VGVSTGVERRESSPKDVVMGQGGFRLRIGAFDLIEIFQEPEIQQ
jgi:hypothetical protein